MTDFQVTTDQPAERALIAAVLDNRADPDEALREIRELLDTAGVQVEGHLVQRSGKVNPKSYLGTGKLEELGRLAKHLDVDLVVVDDELSPSQQRRLEDELERRVVDRTAVILDIFALHARTSEGKLQVELAQLEYNLSRMRGMWTHLERLGGGVGTRGPGESQLETDRRLARRRIALLRNRIADMQSRRGTMRKERAESIVPLVALAGYTNAGKSTLLNALTGADVSVRNRLFETLDPTTRGFEREGRRYLVTDTVGFIERLPHQLIDAFASTLEETLLSDFVLLVADASLPEEIFERQVDAVRDVLTEIGAGELPSLLVLNKVDLLDAERREQLERRHGDAVLVSAATREGLDDLEMRIAGTFASDLVPVELLLPYDDAGLLAELYGTGAPVRRVDEAEGIRAFAHLPKRMLSRVEPYRVDVAGRR